MHLVIIGAGPAGEAAARYAVKQKLKVTLIEKDYMGGLCLNWGCIPTKTLLSSAKKLYDLNHIPLLKMAAKNVEISLNNELWQEMKNEKNRVIQKIRSDLEKFFKTAGIEVVKGEAKFSSKNEILVKMEHEDKIVPFDKALIATGSKPMFFPPFDLLQNDLLENKKTLDLEKIPESMAIIGAGSIGCEFACLFNALGTKNFLIEKMNQILPGEDFQISNVLRKSFEKRGVEIFDSVTTEKISREQGEWKLVLSNQKELSVKEVLVAVGRKADFESLDLSKAGVEYSDRAIKIDSFLKTSNPDIYAAGDVTGLSLLAHAGTVQGEISIQNALGANKTFDKSSVPRCLYTWPETASVGMSKSEAESKGISVKSQRFFFEASGRALSEKSSEGFIQILSETNSGKIIGAQMIGSYATEIIHIISTALKKEMSREELREIIFAHPTFSEGIKLALER